jgi:hypothetical protein
VPSCRCLFTSCHRGIQLTDADEDVPIRTASYAAVGTLKVAGATPTAETCSVPNDPPTIVRFKVDAIAAFDSGSALHEQRPRSVVQIRALPRFIN